MRISVFGLGYVGCVSSACFSDTGHEVIGVDTNPLKVEIINDGRSPVVEPGVEDLIGRGVKDRRVRATTDATDAVHNSDLSLVCVGTPRSAERLVGFVILQGRLQADWSGVGKQATVSRDRDPEHDAARND